MADTGEGGAGSWTWFRNETEKFVARLTGATVTPGTPQMLFAIFLAIVFYVPALLIVVVWWMGVRIWAARILLTLATILVVLSLVGSWFGQWIADQGFADGPCRVPRELRVLSTPDTYQVLRTEAAGFMAEQKKNDCDLTVTVNSVDTFDDLRVAFASEAGAWQPEIQRVPLIPGPHPDIVIPGLTAQAEQLLSVENDGFLLENEGSLASSDVVLAIPTAYDLHDNDLRSLLTTAQNKRLRVARPDPERSEAALLSTRTLYRLDAGRSAKTSERERLEAEVSPSDLSLDSAIAPFCRRGGPDVGIILPRHVFNAFDGDQIPRSLCAGSEITAVDYKPIKITDVPPLDYPFVHVRWPGQADRERDELIGEFRTWLREHLPSHGFEAPAADGGISEGQYDDTLTAYREARREAKVLFLLDNSESMQRTVADGRSLDRGGVLIGRITDRLGDNDWAALWALPGEGQGGASEQVAGGPVTIEQKRKLKNQVAELELTTGRYSPIYAGLVHAVRRTADPGDLTVILVTDGENRVTQGQPAEDLPFGSVVEELVATGTRLEVLAVAPEECSFEDLRKLDRRPDPAVSRRCVPAAYTDVDTLASEVVGRLRAGS